MSEREALAADRDEADVELTIAYAINGCKEDNRLGRDCSAWIRVLHALGLSHAEIRSILDE